MAHSAQSLLALSLVILLAVAGGLVLGVYVLNELGLVDNQEPRVVELRCPEPASPWSESPGPAC